MYQQHSLEVFQLYFNRHTKAWFSPVRLIYSHSLLRKVWTLIFYRTESNLSNFYVIISEKKRKRFVFNSMRLFYFKEKPTTPLRHGGKTMKKHMFQGKNLFIRMFLLKWKLLKHLWKHIQDPERLAEELQKYPCLYEKGNKGYKERDWQENAWRAVEQFLIGFLWRIRDQAILWKAVHFSWLLSLESSLYK